MQLIMWKCAVKTASFLYKLCSYRQYLCALFPTFYFMTNYSIETTKSICLTLLLACNSTAICAMSSFGELYSQNCWVSPTFYPSPILVHTWWHVWEILESYNLCYHFISSPTLRCGRADMLIDMMCIENTRKTHLIFDCHGGDRGSLLWWDC